SAMNRGIDAPRLAAEQERSEHSVLEPETRRARAQRVELERLAELLVGRTELGNAARMKQPIHFDGEGVGARLFFGLDLLRVLPTPDTEADEHDRRDGEN